MSMFDDDVNEQYPCHYGAMEDEADRIMDMMDDELMLQDLEEDQ